MNADRLLAHYEQIADAPDAIVRLRRFILDLAVRGKLVPQDPDDEPVEEFWKSIDAASQFKLPNSWKWIHIGDQLDLLNGMAFKPTDWAQEGLPIVRIQNLNNANAPFNFCKPEMARERSLIDSGSFLISWSGTPGTSFGAFIWNRGPAVLNQHIFRCDFKTKSFTAKFLRLAINGRLDEMIAKAHGGVGLQHITKGKLEALLIPLPPLPEQHRIVDKFNELMALCDQLEAARAEQEAARNRLAAASLARLNAPTPETFEEDARFALNALPALTTRPDQIKALRQTILNLAARGKLVPQDPNDEPASELLKRIAQEKARLRLKTLNPPIIDTELPHGWSAAIIGSYATDVFTGPFGSMLHQSDYIDGGIPLINPSHMKDDRIAHDPKVSVDTKTASRLSSYALATGDIVMARRGEVGRAALVEPAQHGWLCGTGSFYLRFLDEVNRRFLLLVLRTSELRTYLVGKAVGTTMVNLNHGILKNARLSVPPLAEQHRIVAKVDELMALCDQLEDSLTNATSTRSRLLNALLAEALMPMESHELEAAE